MEFSNKTFSILYNEVEDIQPENLVVLEKENGERYAFDITQISNDLNNNIDEIWVDSKFVPIDSILNYQMIRDKFLNLLQRNNLSEEEKTDINNVLEKINKKINELQNMYIYKPSTDVVELIYRIACFSQFVQNVLRKDEDGTMVKKEKNEQEKKNIHRV